MSVLRFFMLLSLVVWVGGIIFFAFVVAPTLFGVLPSRNLAGAVVSRSLAALHWIGIASGIVFLLASSIESRQTFRRVRVIAVRNLLVAAMVVITLVSQFAVAGRMQKLRAEMGDIDAVSVTDTRRIEFNRLHEWSTRLEGAVLVLGLAAVLALAREWKPKRLMDVE